MQLKFRPADVDNDGIQLLLVCRQNNLHAAPVGLGCNKSSQVNKSYLKTRGEDECGECVTVDTYGKRRRRHEIMTWKLTILFLLNLLNEQMNTSAGMWVCGRTYACIHIFYAQFDKRASWKRDLNGRLNERLTDWLTDWLVGWMTKWLSDIPASCQSVWVVSHSNTHQIGVCFGCAFLFDLHRRKCSGPNRPQDTRPFP